MYECPNCGGNLKFDIARQQLYCGYCGTTADPYSFRKEKDAEETVSAEEGGKAGVYEATVFTCPQCGGQIVSEDTTAATFCSFCGSSTILDSRISRERRPGYIIPFTKTEEDCRKAYAKMMRRAIFAPGELKDGQLVERFRGIYMPYWVYSFQKKGSVVFSGHKSRRQGDYKITDHYQLDCEIEAEYRGLAYDASAAFSDSLSSAIAPFDLRQGKTFTPSFLSGFYADTNDVENYVYQTEAEAIVVEDGCRRLASDRVCTKYHAGEGSCRNSMKNAVRPSGCSAELALLPVWFLSYRSGDRVGYAVVNGQTGKAAADLPVAPARYLLGSLLLALPLFVLLNLTLTVTPTKILLIAAFLAFVCILIANGQISRILDRESGADDKGLVSVQPSKSEAAFPGNRRQRKIGGGGSRVGRILLVCIGAMVLPHVLLNLLMLRSNGVSRMGEIVVILAVAVLVCRIPFWMKGAPGSSGRRKGLMRGHFKEKLPTLAKPLAGIAAAGVILIWNPVSDWFYYIGAFACMGTVLWAFMDIIRHHNILTTRKLPQFNRRGGDGIE